MHAAPFSPQPLSFPQLGQDFWIVAGIGLAVITTCLTVGGAALEWLYNFRDAANDDSAEIFIGPGDHEEICRNLEANGCTVGADGRIYPPASGEQISPESDIDETALEEKLREEWGLREDPPGDEPANQNAPAP